METTASVAARTEPSASGTPIRASTSRPTSPMAARSATSMSPRTTQSCVPAAATARYSIGMFPPAASSGSSEATTARFNVYDSVVVSAGYDQSVRAWDCRSHSTEPIQIIDTFQDSVMSVCLTKTEIIAGSVDGTVRTFDIRIGREIVDSLGPAVNCISLSNDSNCVLANCLDSTIRLLDRTTGELLQEYKGHTCKSYKMDCCLTNTDAHVTGGSEDGTIYFWDLVDASVVSSFKAHRSVVTSVNFHPKECCMLTSSVDGTVRVWRQ
ncbi:WD repeat domain-containing protein 83-like isoform X2 [Zingiber officinale]|uniref:WD repeat domain-containing protein 83-like isoform X2 n=1 Tax=Zingiber officinale TaxID=94328 RepID=UPI001C4C277B|nr:WD repeat domain-containing protein 83-like isoform X2 [Zingiber officinale]XP_042392966.1 WD repeat domain-containing protein 83-like isoform X2 [Zingiber officinale]